ncbi:MULTISPECIES: 4-oxalocrotonate tautomerase family protein [unclassified Burkholderia]|uniref:tautomerase family protein n=1 Tax=unclassified Burkholderia TaxID=2613784 RepID=UPI00046AFE66|nr:MULTISPECIES: 4-oxalocrotonate tautomerase family protein [unclassified Burkholderia]NIE84799.1 4-oxalocrotonate tautomerase family protein [Burkholderia sp. Tr-860]NIF63259.1 4-oxalocrotonate tautomerase family protein [Burkholderia sp. Cy-647]NIF96090.1 4-oxalocrotonate tautomerase family protein [Burkholderia sp. Ax-1720]
MPLVTIKGIEGVFSEEQKQLAIRKVTDVLVDIEGERMRPITWVIFEEVKGGDWGIAGNCLGAADVKAVQSGAVSVRDAIGAP